MTQLHSTKHNAPLYSPTRTIAANLLYIIVGTFALATAGANAVAGTALGVVVCSVLGALCLGTATYGAVKLYNSTF